MVADRRADDFRQSDLHAGTRHRLERRRSGQVPEHHRRLPQRGRLQGGARRCSARTCPTWRPACWSAAARKRRRPAPSTPAAACRMTCGGNDGFMAVDPVKHTLYFARRGDNGRAECLAGGDDLAGRCEGSAGQGAGVGELGFGAAPSSGRHLGPTRGSMPRPRSSLRRADLHAATLSRGMDPVVCAASLRSLLRHRMTKPQMAPLAAEMSGRPDGALSRRHQQFSSPWPMTRPAFPLQDERQQSRGPPCEN